MGVYLQNQSGINRICRHRYREREENGAAGNRTVSYTHLNVTLEKSAKAQYLDQALRFMVRTQHLQNRQ